MTDWCTWIFDCDGVLLDTNELKASAMERAAASYGDEKACVLSAYHSANGGVSRDEKFQWFLREVIGRVGDLRDEIDFLKAEYAKILALELPRSITAAGLTGILSKLGKKKLFVVSGGEQKEVGRVLEEKGLSRYFDGIFGAPDDKHEILCREFEAGEMAHPAVFLGDSRFDHEAALAAGLDFVFLSGWTDFEGWQEYFKDYPNVIIESSISDFYTKYTNCSGLEVI